jgi:hypothetical protein
MGMSKVQKKRTLLILQIYEYTLFCPTIFHAMRALSL